MDTGTHLVMGIGLFALAHLDPALTHTPTTHAVLAGTIIGSQAPDSDTVYRLINNTLYIKNHRGFSHSLPMFFLWPLLITAIIYLFLPEAHLLHLWLWTWLAVFIHIFIDLFNTYGTQALRPITKEWISWDILNIFDPFLFALHLVGFLMWFLLPAYPGQIFAIIYAIIILYVAWRTWTHQRLLEWVKKETAVKGQYLVTPTYQWDRWNVILVQPHQVRMGEIRQKQLLWTGHLSLQDQDHPAVIASKKASTVQAFLSFTSYGFPQVLKHSFGYEVRWLDVRYHHKRHFPFLAVVLLDQQLQIIDSYVGWKSKEQLERDAKQFM
jgi:inner membrane protein